jgi:hypothetical protein
MEKRPDPTDPNANAFGRLKNAERYLQSDEVGAAVWELRKISVQTWRALNLPVFQGSEEIGVLKTRVSSALKRLLPPTS